MRVRVTSIRVDSSLDAAENGGEFEVGDDDDVDADDAVDQSTADAEEEMLSVIKDVRAEKDGDFLARARISAN